MPVVGLTGGIATGKSTVAEELRALGAIILSADEAARKVTAPGGLALPAIVARFGSDVLSPDGSLDRAALASRVFADPAERRALEEITHPHILALLRHEIDATFGEHPDAIIVVEVPLLYEAGLRGWFDAVVVVAASEGVQVERQCRSRGTTPAEAIARIRSQMPIADKVADADRTIWNDGDRENLARQVRSAMREIQAHVSTRKARPD